MGAGESPTFQVSPLGEFAGLGGRGLTSAVIAAEVPPTCHPLSAENKLVIAPGLLSGTMAAMSGRLSIGCKSPLTGGYQGIECGGPASSGPGPAGICRRCSRRKTETG